MSVGREACVLCDLKGPVIAVREVCFETFVSHSV